MRRRGFITLLGGAAAWPMAARAQQAAMPVIGFLNVASPTAFAANLAAFLRGLREGGYVDGQNVAIEYRWANDHYDRLSGLAADLVQGRVDVIAATGGANAALAAKPTTSTIPIVFMSGSDPIDVGLVSSLSRPTGNLTGVSSLNVELLPKRIQLLCDMLPGGTTISYLLYSGGAGAGAERSVEKLEAIVRSLGRQFRLLNVHSDEEIEAAFKSLARTTTSGMLIGTSSYFNSRVKQIGALSVRYVVPAVYQLREFATAGGLVSYGANLPEAHYQVGIYTARILKGEKPAELPVQQVTRVELIINQKTARALGLTIPLPLLGLADEVVE